MIKYVKGNLFNSLPKNHIIKVVCHICNDEGRWGSGFVVPLGKAFPTSEEGYHRWHDAGIYQNQIFQLGNIQTIECRSDVYVVNMIAQCGVVSKDNPTPIKYWALAQCLKTIADNCWWLKDGLGHDVEFHCPKFGSGLAQGNWDFIETLINESLSPFFPVTIYEL